jgi:CubicO group peptidase (beta-lactamase class C family)
MKAPSMLETQTISQQADKSEAVDAIFDGWTKGARPGVGVAIIQDGNPIHKRGYGLANLEAGFPIDSKTSFRLASLTKQFTAMAIMILAESGQLRYDDPIDQYLPDFSPPSRTVTIRHLLNHTSGVPDYEELYLKAGIIDPDYPASLQEEHKGFEPTFWDAVKLISRERLRFSPSDQWEYSNSGYVLLAGIVERVSGRPFSMFLKQNIFDPLGMTDSILSERVRPEPITNRASGYVSDNGIFRESDYAPFNAIYGPDGVYSTLDDMIKWCQSLDGEKLVNSSTLNEAFRSGELNNGARTGYGFGWFTSKYYGSMRVSHTGSWMGFRSFVVYYPEQRFSILVLSNCAEFDDVARSVVCNRLSKIYLGGPNATLPTLQVKSEKLSRYVGKYELKTGEIFEISLHEGTLQVDTALFPIRLIPESNVKFFVEGAESDSYFFHEDDKGRVNGVIRQLSLFGYSNDAYQWARKLNVR